MWGLVLSAATIGISTILGSKEQPEQKAMTRYPNFLKNSDDRIFISGAVLGIGCSLLYSTIVTQFRVTDRCRMAWRYFFNFDENKELFPYRVPKDVTEGEFLENVAEKVEDGNIRLIVTPETIATSTLHISVITIEPGRELTSFKAPHVEFYYVLSCPLGVCSFSQQGVSETTILKEGHCVVVDAGRQRWISNYRGRKPLVLLRVTDGGKRYNRVHEKERICLDSTLKRTNSPPSMMRVSTMERLKRGMLKVRDFVSRSNNNIAAGQDTDGSR